MKAVSKGPISVTRVFVAFLTCGLSIPFLGIRHKVLRTRV